MKRDIDINKVMPKINDQWDAIREMGNAQKHLVDAIHIMECVLDFNTEDDKEINERMMNNFINKFTK